MGLNASKRVESAFKSSPVFDAACESVYAHCLAQAEHAFPGVRPYQLPDATARLHAALLAAPLPLVRRWVQSPPARTQVDATLRRIVAGGAGEALGPGEFRAFATELFRDAVLAGAGRAVLRREAAGAAAIAGVGVATRVGAEVLGTALGIYAVGVAAAVYLRLS